MVYCECFGIYFFEGTLGFIENTFGYIGVLLCNNGSTLGYVGSILESPLTITGIITIFAFRR